MKKTKLTGTIDLDEWCELEEFAELIAEAGGQLSISSLRQWARHKGGPERIALPILYRRADAVKWADPDFRKKTRGVE